jgi:hypothetical protein
MAINATLSANDVILVMPTGGKCVCFQLPALLEKGFYQLFDSFIHLLDRAPVHKERDKLKNPSGVATLSVNWPLVTFRENEWPVTDLQVILIPNM